jgi:alkyl sulfatase BDS1-like metallo-beta-lactamase superfamily hydrolase
MMILGPWRSARGRGDIARVVAANADAKITLTKATLNRILLGEINPEGAITSGDMKVEGRREAFADFAGMLDRFPFWFNIVTP